MEENLKHKKAPPEEVETERKAKAYPILKYLETYMLDVHKQYTPGEAMEKALRYAFAVWIRSKHPILAAFVWASSFTTFARKTYVCTQRNKCFSGLLHSRGYVSGYSSPVPTGTQQ
ncbi:hypothetical protein ABVC73_04385 [Prevotella melaninogenica]